MNSNEKIVLDDASPLWFGKHKGVALANCPAGYLLWCYDDFLKNAVRCTGMNAALKKYIEENMQGLKQEAGL